MERILKSRMDMAQNRTIDWAMGEALAFGSLMKDGKGSSALYLKNRVISHD